MRTLSKQEFSDTLRKKVSEVTEDEFRFIFNILGFDLKEATFAGEELISFEIHWRRYYIIKVTVEGGVLTFSSPWIIFNDDDNSRAVGFECPSSLVALISLFYGAFGSSLLSPIDYNPGYIEGWSALSNPTESKEYWDEIASILSKNSPKDNEGSKPAPQVKAPKRPVISGFPMRKNKIKS